MLREEEEEGGAEEEEEYEEDGSWDVEVGRFLGDLGKYNPQTVLDSMRALWALVNRVDPSKRRWLAS